MLSAPAVAQVKPADAAAARALFDEGKALVEQGKAAQACPKFEESRRLDPGIGTSYRLADCYEAIGRTASAWAIFLDVAGQARAANQPEREEVARKRAADLLPRLSKLALKVAPGADTTGFEVKRDGSVIGKGMWGTAVPVDPGKHVVVATAPGRRRWIKVLHIAASAQETVEVPMLPESTSSDRDTDPVPEPVLDSAPETPSPRTADSAPAAAPSNTQKTVGIIVASAGVVSVGIAGYFGYSSWRNMTDSESHCDADRCNQAGVDLRDKAVAQQTVAYVTSGIGAAAILAGGIIALTAPSARPSRHTDPTTVFAVGPTGFLIRGRF